MTPLFAFAYLLWLSRAGVNIPALNKLSSDYPSVVNEQEVANNPCYQEKYYYFEQDFCYKSYKDYPYYNCQNNDNDGNRIHN
jgi:hypothetical protein